MLIEYIQVCLVCAIFFTHNAFSKNTEEMGKTFYFLMGSLMWVIAAYGMLKIKWRVVGGGVIDFTYIPSWEAEIMIYSLGVCGMLMFIMGIYNQFFRTVKLVVTEDF